MLAHVGNNVNPIFCQKISLSSYTKLKIQEFHTNTTFVSIRKNCKKWDLKKYILNCKKYFVCFFHCTLISNQYYDGRKNLNNKFDICEHSKVIFN